MKLWFLIICLLSAICTASFAKSSYAVIVEESPVGAGEIMPGTGVHTFGINQTINLTTVPKAGYHFVYWIGDVGDPTANNTTMAVDGPKIIIAVFARNEYEFELPDSDMPIGSGPEKLTRRFNETSNGGSGGIIPPNNPDFPHFPDNPPDDPPPVPEVPEPATMLLFGIGASLLVINRKK